MLWWCLPGGFLLRGGSQCSTRVRCGTRYRPGQTRPNPDWRAWKSSRRILLVSSYTFLFACIEYLDQMSDTEKLLQIHRLWWQRSHREIYCRREGLSRGGWYSYLHQACPRRGSTLSIYSIHSSSSFKLPSSVCSSWSLAIPWFQIRVQRIEIRIAAIGRRVLQERLGALIPPQCCVRSSEMIWWSLM